MRTLLLVIFCACAHDQAQAVSPAPVPTGEEQVTLRACESCRHDLDLCRQRSSTIQASASGPVGAECMDTFMKCLDAQQLDTARCAGLN